MFDFDLLRPERVRPLKRTEYETLVKDGVFGDEKVELLHGFIVEMSPQGEEPVKAIVRLNRILVGALAGRADVMSHSSFAANEDSMPEPDLAIVPLVDSTPGLPSRAFLLVEASDSSLAKDRRIKAPLYAAAGISEYWILDLEARVIEVYRDPASGGYRSVERLGSDASIALSAFPDIRVSVAAVLPKP